MSFKFPALIPLTGREGVLLEVCGLSQPLSLSYRQVLDSQKSHNYALEFFAKNLSSLVCLDIYPIILYMS